MMFDLSDYQILYSNDVRFIRLSDTLILMMLDLFDYQILDFNDVRFILLSDYQIHVPCFKRC